MPAVFCLTEGRFVSIKKEKKGGRKLKLMDQAIEKKAEAKGGDHEK